MEEITEALVTSSIWIEQLGNKVESMVLIKRMSGAFAYTNYQDG